MKYSAYNIIELIYGIIIMSKYKFDFWNHIGKKCDAGFIVASVGIGIVVAVIIPFWGLLLAVGISLVFIGWYLVEHK
ncbi:MAG: hypothetical protein K0R54_3940 [Clostridiaceae bacterium]|jgi:hypothetical protein|nr:hypothetical protein [Clostridiaceae bacterium]